eukprot:CAMPEP_0170132034 /NCGR_PEP_ID=MMETSP0020_2-20130122/23625_1 /TAXON_ID=98059 /ORGANISM="Dinobryon sp., Strain UTEXLB2267" /LENGTH=1746 /DNA_ID=CAMNT_0010367267 /DNA_START=155 /DNA_END=5396 /DNA_ORIENTATION=-
MFSKARGEIKNEEKKEKGEKVAVKEAEKQIEKKSLAEKIVDKANSLLGGKTINSADYIGTIVNLFLKVANVGAVQSVFESSVHVTPAKTVLDTFVTTLSVPLTEKSASEWTLCIDLVQIETAFRSMTIYLLLNGKNSIKFLDVEKVIKDDFGVDIREMTPFFIANFIERIKIEDFQFTLSNTQLASSFSGRIGIPLHSFEWLESLYIRDFSLELSLNFDRYLSNLSLQAVLTIGEKVRVVAKPPPSGENYWLFEVTGAEFSVEDFDVTTLDLRSTKWHQFLEDEEAGLKPKSSASSSPDVVVSEFKVAIAERKVIATFFQLEGNFTIGKPEYFSVEKPSLLLHLFNPFDREKRKVEFGMKFKLEICRVSLDCETTVKKEVGKKTSGELKATIKEKYTIGDVLHIDHGTVPTIELPYVSAINPLDYAVSPSSLTYSFGKAHKISIKLPDISIVLGGETKCEFSIATRLNDILQRVEIVYVKYDKNSAQSTWTVKAKVDVGVLLHDIGEIFGEVNQMVAGKSVVEADYNISSKMVEFRSIFPDKIQLSDSFSFNNCLFYLKPSPFSLGVGGTIKIVLWSNHSIEFGGDVFVSPAGITGKLTIKYEFPIGAHVKITEIDLILEIGSAGGEVKFKLNDREGDIMIDLTTTVPPTIKKFNFLYPGILSIRELVDAFVGKYELLDEILDVLSTIKMKGVKPEQLQDVLAQYSKNHNPSSSQFSQIDDAPPVSTSTSKQGKWNLADYSKENPPILISFDVVKSIYEVDVDVDLSLLNKECINGFAKGSFSLKNGIDLTGAIDPLKWTLGEITLFSISGTDEAIASNSGKAAPLKLIVKANPSDLKSAMVYFDGKIEFIGMNLQVHVDISKDGVKFFTETGLFGVEVLKAEVKIDWREELYAVATLQTDFLHEICQNIEKGLKTYVLWAQEEMKKAKAGVEDAEASVLSERDKYNAEVAEKQRQHEKELDAWTKSFEAEQAYYDQLIRDRESQLQKNAANAEREWGIHQEAIAKEGADREAEIQSRIAVVDEKRRQAVQKWEDRVAGARAAVTSAQTAVDNWNKNIATFQSKIQECENKIAEIKANGYFYILFHCWELGWQYMQIGGYYIAIGGLYVTQKVAQGVLYAAQKVLAAIPDVAANMETFFPKAALEAELLAEKGKNAIEAAAVSLKDKFVQTLQEIGSDAEILLYKSIKGWNSVSNEVSKPVLKIAYKIESYAEEVINDPLGAFCAAVAPVAVGVLKLTKSTLSLLDSLNTDGVNLLLRVVNAVDNFFQITKLTFEGVLSSLHGKYIRFSLEYRIHGEIKTIGFTINFNNVIDVLTDFVDAVTHKILIGSSDQSKTEKSVDFDSPKAEYDAQVKDMNTCKDTAKRIDLVCNADKEKLQMMVKEDINRIQESNQYNYDLIESHKVLVQSYANMSDMKSEQMSINYDAKKNAEKYSQSVQLDPEIFPVECSELSVLLSKHVLPVDGGGDLQAKRLELKENFEREVERLGQQRIEAINSIEEQYAQNLVDAEAEFLEKHGLKPNLEEMENLAQFLLHGRVQASHQAIQQHNNTIAEFLETEQGAWDALMKENNNIETLLYSKALLEDILALLLKWIQSVKDSINTSKDKFRSKNEIESLKSEIANMSQTVTEFDNSYGTRDHLTQFGISMRNLQPTNLESQFHHQDVRKKILAEYNEVLTSNQDGKIQKEIDGYDKKLKILFPIYQETYVNLVEVKRELANVQMREDLISTIHDGQKQLTKTIRGSMPNK